MERGRLLFCDYDGSFELADRLSLSGYLIDQIRPDGLRGVTVGDHSVYIFVFQKSANGQAVQRICEKLKAAELLTPIIAVNRGAEKGDELAAPIEFANFTLVGDSPESELRKIIKNQLRILPPETVGDSTDVFVLDPQIENDLMGRVQQLEAALKSLSDENEKLKQVTPAEDFRPKLQAMLEGEKKKAQTETERLQCRLAEIEAKLLGREARLKDLESQQAQFKDRATQMKDSFQKAQASLREFYMTKIRELESKLGVESNFTGGPIQEEKTILLYELAPGLNAVATDSDEDENEHTEIISRLGGPLAQRDK